ncbi:fatty-acyl-CoA synthase [Pseudonocardia thermophila]|uniref:Fatty-acyl-CoA synthase n=1 Tax=Pseudonocardia thermophila TaxID=1848 RepID=A0A1M6UGZ4_PSETH|nr:AMP-binding protein [Pseudonocardia thermophila]SHK68494.1 fatty-acyl-CoA synthase [Pseudonocardia thermophila]
MTGPGLADLWHALVDELGDRVAVSCGEDVRTWDELDARAALLAGHLRACGLAPGDRVAVGLRNGVAFVEVLFALVKAGLTPVNLNVRYRAAEMRHLLVDSGAQGMVVSAAMAPVALEAAAGTAAVRVGVVVPDGSGDGCDLPGYADVLAAAAPLPRTPRSAEDLLILYTGGTTGRPKGTVWPHGELMGIAAGDYRRRGETPPETLADARRIARRIGRSAERPVTVPASPLMHGTGLFAALGALAVGGECALLAGPSFSAAELWETVQRRRVTEIVIIGDVFCAPMVAELDRAAAAGDPYDLSSLRMVRSAGMRWSAESKRALLEHADIALVDVIASSEGGPYGVATTVRGDDPVTARFTLAPGARVLTEDGRDVVPGSGEIGLLAAPGRMSQGYLDDPTASATTFRMIDGVRYVVPGDRATLAADGSLILLGRSSGVINSGGEKIDAEEVEQVLVRHPAVADAVVVAVPDPRWGQTPNALVTLRPGTTATEEELIAHVRESLASYKKPSRVLFVPEIMRTPVGKPDRRWAGEFAARTPPITGTV